MAFGKNPSSGSKPNNAAPGGKVRTSPNGGANRAPSGGKTNSGAPRSLIRRDLKGNIWFIAAVVGALFVSLGVFFIVNQLNSTSTYYVLNQNVPAGTQIQPGMLQEVVVTAGGQPRNALTIGDVSAEPAITKFALNAGDIVTISNTGPLTDLNADIPEGFVVASFTVPAERSVAGQLERGNYIDIITLNSGTAVYALRHILILDAAADPASAGAGAGVGTGATGNTGGGGGIGGVGQTSANPTTIGVPTLYTVALSRQDALSLALAQDLSMFVVLSPADYETNSIIPDSLIETIANLFSGTNEVGNGGIGTDPTFGSGVVDENVVTNSNSQSQSGNLSSSPSSTPSESSSEDETPEEVITEEVTEEVTTSD